MCQLIFNKDAKEIQWKNGKSFQQIVLEQLDIHMPRTENFYPSLVLHTKLTF